MSSRCTPSLLTQRFLQREQEPEVPVPPPGTFTDAPTQVAQPPPPPPPTFLLPNDTVSPSLDLALGLTDYPPQTASDAFLREILEVMRVCFSAALVRST